MTGFGRRELLQVAAATAALALASPALAQQRYPRQEDLLRFNAVGQVTLLNFTDLHAQLVPVYIREPSANIGVGAARGLPPHLVGEKLLAAYKIDRGTFDAYALAYTDFEALARSFGRLGGLDRLAALIKAIRAERQDKVLLLDGGDTWQGSYTALQSRGADMVRLMNALGVDAMTAHWEFTYGADRVRELIKQLAFPFLAGNVKDATWGDPVFKPYQVFERGGVRIGVIGQAFPYTPIANPGYLIPDWSFGIDEEGLAKHIGELRDDGVDRLAPAADGCLGGGAEGNRASMARDLGDNGGDRAGRARWRWHRWCLPDPGWRRGYRRARGPGNGWGRGKGLS